MNPFHAGHEHLARADSLSDFITAWDPTSPLTLILAASFTLYAIGAVRLLRRAARTVPGSEGRAARGESGAAGAGSGRSPLPWWRGGFAAGGYLILVFALIGPPDLFAGEVFFLHMIQHLLLIMAAAPMILMSSPVAVYLWALPASARLRLGGAVARSGAVNRLIATLTTPRLALTLFVGSLWIWHIPALYELALKNEAVHFAEHLTIFAAALLFWWPIIGPAPIRSSLSYPQRILYLLLAVTPIAALGALITLVDSLYPFYETVPDHWGMSDAEDQSLGGLLMWVPGNFVFLSVLTVLFFRWSEQEETDSIPPLKPPGPG